MANKNTKIERLNQKKEKLVFEINNLIKKDDDKIKFQALIRNCKSLTNTIHDLQLEGVKVRLSAQKYSYEYWAERYDAYINSNKAKIIQQKSVTNKEKKCIYNILLCWTVKIDYCICESIIKKLQDYLIKMNMKLVDSSNDNFIDRIEHCETYQIKTTENVFNTILKSAEYILDISADSIYDKCNIAVFGKKS